MFVTLGELAVLAVQSIAKQISTHAPRSGYASVTCPFHVRYMAVRVGSVSVTYPLHISFRYLPLGEASGGGSEQLFDTLQGFDAQPYLVLQRLHLL